MSKKNHYYYNKKNNHINQVEKYNPPYAEDLLSKSIDELNFHPKTLETLKNNKIATVRDLAIRSEKDLFKLQGLNKKSFFDIEKKLGAIGVKIKPTEQNANPNTLNAKPTTEQNKQNTANQPTKNAKELLNSALQRTERNTFKNNSVKPKVEEKEDLPIYKKYISNGKYGMKGQDNSVIIPPEYDELYSFKEGLACFEKDGYYGFLDEKNNIIIPADKYVLASSFSEGLAAVMVNEKYGYINKNNEMVIKPQFEAATSFENGESRVKIDGKWGALFLDGSIRLFK